MKPFAKSFELTSTAVIDTHKQVASSCPRSHSYLLVNLLKDDSPPATNVLYTNIITRLKHAVTVCLIEPIQLISNLCYGEMFPQRGIERGLEERIRLVIAIKSFLGCISWACLKTFSYWRAFRRSGWPLPVLLPALT